jgi:Rrf2 family protein
LRSMMAIARHANESKPISLEKVSRTTGISRRYLEQLAIGLKSSGLLRSVSGRGGGYYLARAADQIHLGEIVEAAIGPVNVVECAGLPETCKNSQTCEARLIYLLINRRIREVLGEFSLKDLADDAWQEKIGEELKQDALDRLDTGPATRRTSSAGSCPSPADGEPTS